MAEVPFYDRVQVETSTTGTGASVAVGSAVTGYMTPAEAGVQDGAVVNYVIEDGDDFEFQIGQTYSSSGPSLSRGTPSLSKISGTVGTSQIDLSGSARVAIVPFARDVSALRRIFDTKADVEATEIPPHIDAIATAGYAAAGDGGGARYKRSGTEPSHGGKIQSADGAWWEIAETTFTAAQFGFSVAGSAAANKAALEAMIAAAAGRPCFVDADQDFVCSTVTVDSSDLDITFRGPGRWDVSSGGGVFVLRSSYTDVQAITAFGTETIVIQGTSQTVPRLSVADESGYAKGDLVRVVSDDIDPDASATGTRRRGEAAEVVATAPGFIYLATQLEDDGLYTTNPRVARLIKRSFRVKGLKVLSSESNDSALVNIVAAYRPYLEMHVETHGFIAVDAVGCILGEFHLSGSGKGDSTGSLGYMFNDNNGVGNRVIAPRGRYWRHMCTANFAVTEADDDEIEKYGACRDHTVIDGVAEASQGSPFDDHEGARRTRWINCRAYSALRNDTAIHAAFQARGRDAEIINCYADKSHAAFLFLSGNSRGSVIIRGGRSDCILMNAANDTATRVYIYDHHCRASGQECVRSGGAEIYIKGGIIENNTSLEFAQVIRVMNGSVIYLDGVELILAGSGESGRFIALLPDSGQSAKVYGSVKTRRRTTGSVSAIVRHTGDGNATAHVRIHHLEGTLPTPVLGNFVASSYALHDNVGGAHATSVTTLENAMKLVVPV